MAAVSKTVGYQLPSPPEGRLAPNIAGRPAPPRRRGRPPERRLGETELRALVDHGTAEDMADVLLTVGEPARRALGGLVSTFAAETGPPPRRRGGHADRERRESTLLVAGAGCLAGADRVVQWLRSRRFRHCPSAATLEAIVRVLSADGRPRMLTVAGAMARQLRARAAWPGEWAVTEALLLAAEVPPPGTDEVALRWIRERSTAGERLADRLAEDPWLDRLLPRVFFPPDHVVLDNRWAGALARLASSGRLERGALIRLALRRMGSPGPGGSLRMVVALYRLLAPATSELAKHRAEFVRLLAGPEAAVAGLAQEALIALDEAGRLDLATVGAAGRAVLLRTEKKLFRTQLGWMSKAAARRPEGGRPILEAMAAGLANESPDLVMLAREALDRLPGGSVVLREATPALPEFRAETAASSPERASLPPAAHPAAPPPERQQPLSAAASTSPASLLSWAPEAAAPNPVTPDVLGPAIDRLATGISVAEARAVSPMRPREFPAAPIRMTADPMPAPIASVAELAEEMAARRPDPWEPVALERILAGLATLARSDRAALAVALTPLLRGTESPLDVLIRALAHGRGDFVPRSDAPARPNRYGGSRETTTHPLRDNGIAHRRRLGDPRRRAAVPPPQAMVLGRIRELAEHLAAGAPPPLLATPATADGHVYPARVLFRLLEAERDGWQPAPHDLTQALLRLPRHVDPAVVAASARLRSPAGRRYAAWLRAGGLPDPATAARPTPGDPTRRTVTLGRLVPSAWAPDAGVHADAIGGASAVLHRLLTEQPHAPGDEAAQPAGTLTAQPHGTGGATAPLDRPLTARLDAGGGASAVFRPLLAARPGDDEGGHDARCWPMVLPSHREVATVHCLAWAGPDGLDGEVLAALARAEGPFGAAMAIALARGLGAEHASARDAAVDALVHLAAHGGLDAGLLGRELRLLIGDDVGETALVGTAARVAGSLAGAGRAGAWHLVWALAYAAVPGLLRLDPAPVGLAELVGVAAEAAEATGARGELDGLSAAAERVGDPRLRSEAARLARAIG